MRALLVIGALVALVASRRPAKLGALYGADRATPGPAFGDARVGGDVGKADDEPFPIHGMYRISGSDFVEVHASVPTGDCGALAQQLDDAWGESPDHVWLDRSGSVRASVRPAPDGTDCELRFQRYVPQRRWLAMTTTAEVPLGLIGRSAHDVPTTDRGTHFWLLGITGRHMQRAHVTMTEVHGRITEVHVGGEIDVHGGADELRELIRPYLRGPLKLTLSIHGGSFELDVTRRAKR